MAEQPDGGVGSVRRDPEGTQRQILDAAIEEFSAHGLLGGRIDAIAERTATTKRMIYYYFGGKEQLYAAALLESYRRIRESEVELHLDGVPPEQALRALIRDNIAHHADHPEFVRLVVFENTLPSGAIHLMTPEAREQNRSALLIIDDILRRGRAAGVFRDGPDAPDAVDVQQVLSGLAFQRVSNRSTFRALYGRDMLGTDEQAHVTAMIEDVIMRYVLVDPDRRGPDGRAAGEAGEDRSGADHRSSGTIVSAPQGHSAAQIPQPLQ